MEDRLHIVKFYYKSGENAQETQRRFFESFQRLISVDTILRIMTLRFQFVASMLMREQDEDNNLYNKILWTDDSQHQEYTTGEIQITGQQLTLINMK